MTMIMMMLLVLVLLHTGNMIFIPSLPFLLFALVRSAEKERDYMEPAFVHAGGL
jgi:hypothetical protein